MTIEEVGQRIKACLAQLGKLTISCIGFNIANIIASQPRVKVPFEAMDIVLADGIAVIWASRLWVSPSRSNGSLLTTIALQRRF